MPLSYNAKDAIQCWPAGEYPATLQGVEDKFSKTKPDGTGGNPMQVWTFHAFDSDGREQVISDYVVVPAATWKIKQLAIALGKKSDFDQGAFQADDYIGSNVLLDLIIEAQSGFDEKNKVKKIKATNHVDAALAASSPKPPSRQMAPPISQNKEFDEADIPF